MTTRDRRGPARAKAPGFAFVLQRPLVLFAVLLLIGIGIAVTPPPVRPRGLTSTPPPPYRYAWTQIGVDGVQIARVLTNMDCPTMTADGVAHPMSRRSGGEGHYVEKVCEAPIPAGTTSASLSSSIGPLPLLTGPPERIAVIGDTGCRMESWQGGGEFQACNDPSQWPFAAIAQQVAAWQPDLIIHVGDYLYREAACPAGNSGCAGSPYGDNLATWRADFFNPAEPLFAAAPILFARGNHEVCERAGEGWFRYLDPRPLPATCQEYTDPYAVPLGEVQLLVVDSAAAADEKSTPEETAAYEAQFAEVVRLAGDNAWLVTHKPFWGVIEDKQGQQIQVEDASFAAATGDRLPPGVQLLIAGHIHLAELLIFDPAAGRAPQLIVGNGGTELDRNYTEPLTGLALDDAALATGQTIEQFGFLTLERTDAAWVATERDEQGAAGTTCTLHDGTAMCALAPAP